MKVEQQKNV